MGIHRSDATNPVVGDETTARVRACGALEREDQRLASSASRGCGRNPPWFPAHKMPDGKACRDGGVEVSAPTGSKPPGDQARL